MKLELADETATYVTHKGLVHINSHRLRIILKETYYVPKLIPTLLSCSRKDEHEMSKFSTDNTSTLFDRDE